MAQPVVEYREKRYSLHYPKAVVQRGAETGTRIADRSALPSFFGSVHTIYVLVRLQSQSYTCRGRMLSIIAAVIGGLLFWWLQQTFKKFEHETTPALVIKFACGLCALAVMAFLIPFLMSK